MAKLSLINREKKREALVAKFAAKRADLNKIIQDQSKSEDERYEARLKLQQLPRNASILSYSISGKMICSFTPIL